MLRIFYGVAGQGAGHSSRAKIIIEHLQKQGHEVKIASHDQGYDNLQNYFVVEKIFGLRLVYKNNTVQNFSTLVRNFLKIPQAQKSLRLIFKMIKNFKPEVIFTDFEPLTAVAANLLGVPLVSIDNQHQITNTRLIFPSKYIRIATFAKIVIRSFIFKANYYLVTSFFQTPVTNQKTFLFPPILRQEIFNLQPKLANHILVYVNSEIESLLLVLKQVSAEFIVYGFNKEAIDGNLHFKKNSQEIFLQDLASSRGVIGTAGLSLICESLYLGKPYLALPVGGQFEQILNALYLKKLGYGDYSEKISKEDVESFLKNLSFYSAALSKYKRENNSRIFAKIDEILEKVV